MNLLKNNLRALVYYLLYLVICFVIVVIMVVSASKTGQFIMMWPVRLACTAGMLLVLFFFGSRLRTVESKQADYFAGTLIAVIGLTLVVNSTMQTSGSFMVMPSEEALYYQWGGANLFLLPGTLISLFLDLPRWPWVMVIFSLLPTIIMGAGLRWSRRRLDRE